MATTSTQGFAGLRSNLEITGLQSATVSTRQTNVRDAVAAHMDVVDSFLTGSYMRSTMIAPLKEADIDIFIVLDVSYYHNLAGPAALLDKVKRELKKTYPTTPRISRNGQAVTISFTDFDVDVVPGFYRTGGGYLIPDSVRNTWIPTDPKQHVIIWAAENKKHNGNLIPLIKMLKRWNKKHSALLQSFHLEALILNILDGITISDFPSGVRYVFDKARMAVQYPIPDPAGYNNNIGGYIDTDEKLLEICNRLERATLQAREAESLDASGNTRRAFEKWRTIFGDYFPAYG
ncbi:MAG TPA: CBASS oligonucleotide cyclase [candidate division Zixibacteria bacterium]|nr:CBASS oligonucleotide cyclase [candidate division Zixibacteria bacterium]